MAGKASYRHGRPNVVDYTAAANVTAGDVVLLGNTAGVCNGIAHRDILNTEKSSLSIGGGFYAVKVASNYAAYTKLYWDNTNSVLTSTSTNMSPFGWNVEAAAAANAIVECFHWPLV
jgi:predicted RecA/RadA family phage recombinase